MKLNIILGIIFVSIFFYFLFECMFIQTEVPVFHMIYNEDINNKKADACSWKEYEKVFSNWDSTKEKVSDLSDAMSLELKGTIIGGARNSFAIIRDTITGVETLYKLGDNISGGRIVAMNRERVVIDYDGFKKKIYFDSGQGDDTAGISKQQKANSSHFGLLYSEDMPLEPKEKLQDAPVDFTKILTEIRIKPYFESGQCIGFQLVNIENESMISKLGLQEGDIVQTINGQSVADPLKALQLLYNINRKNPVHLGIERQDSRMELNCKIEG